MKTGPRASGGVLCLRERVGIFFFFNAAFLQPFPICEECWMLEENQSLLFLSALKQHVFQQLTTLRCVREALRAE